MKTASVTKISSFVLLCVVALLSPYVSAAAETITSFAVTLEPQVDGVVKVTEEITYDFGTANRHGIYRDILLSHPQPASAWYKTRGIAIENVSVQMDEGVVPMSLSGGRQVKQVRIGDSNHTITGLHTYTISYDLQGAYSYYDTEPAELYLNVTGNQWQVPIETIEVTVLDTYDLLGTASACYAGKTGSGEAEGGDCTISEESNGVVFRARSLRPGEEMTIAQSFQEGVVAYAPYETWQVWYVFLPLVLLALFGAGVALWRFEIAHRPVARTVIAQYVPCADLLPMFTGVLIDGTLHARDITAGLLYLAQEGYIRIKKTEKKIWRFTTSDYKVTLRKSKNDAPTHFHRSLLDLLFSSAEAGETVSLNSLKNNQAMKKRNYKTLQALKKDIKDNLISEGFFERTFPHRLFWPLSIGGCVIALLSVLQFQEGGFLVIGIVVFVIIISSVSLYERRTARGYEAMYYLRGFKEFLSVTGKDRFKFHNAPAKNPQEFLTNLPYAVAFAVEQEWSEVFADITIPQPEWYNDTAGHAFSASALVSDLGAFSTAFASSSGSSGSSGGGSAGGGAGGGGGGSW